MPDPEDRTALSGHLPLSWHATGTPLQVAERLGAALGFAPGKLWVKRDDLTGLAGGGNKARKLEHLCAEARHRQADTLLTGGAAQSNHVRMTAAAAAALGMRCVAVLFGRPPAVAEGNLVLDQLFGAELVWAAEGRAGRDPDVPAAEPAVALEAVQRRLSAEGAAVYAIPLGGSSPVGALGYVTCADELEAEAPAGSLVVCADGSGGTHAGLAAGFGRHDRVLGVDVGFGDLEGKVGALAAATAALAGRPVPVGEAQIDPGQDAPYGEPTEAVHDALVLAARTEGLVLDPVYTGRAMASLVARRRSGAIAPDQPVVFLHSGGLPALLTSRYRDWFPSPGTR